MFTDLSTGGAGEAQALSARVDRRRSGGDSARMTALEDATEDSHGTSERLRGAADIRRILPGLPAGPGVYRMLDDAGRPLYVGKARSLRKRVASYGNVARQPTRLARMIAETAAVEVVSTHTEAEALLLEANMIKRLRPRYNIVLRDDKSHPYILLTGDDEWPRLVKHRGARSRPGRYFGPFASAGAVNRTLNALQRAFPLRTCSDGVFAGRSRPCLQYQIKRCCGPCVGLVGSEAYEEIVDQTRDFLSRPQPSGAGPSRRAHVRGERGAGIRGRRGAPRPHPCAGPDPGTPGHQSRPDRRGRHHRRASGRRPDLHSGVLLSRRPQLRQPGAFPEPRSRRGGGRRAGRVRGSVLRRPHGAAPRAAQPSRGGPAADCGSAQPERGPPGGSSHAQGAATSASW